MNYTSNMILQFMPSEECTQWCIGQHVTNYNNIEITAVMFVAGALLLLYGYEFFMMKDSLRDKAHHFVYFSKLLLYIFFFMYFIIIRLRMYYYGF